jgi:hypothetical protein
MNTLDKMFGWEKFRICPVCLLEVPEDLHHSLFKKNLMLDPANQDDTSKRWRLIHIGCLYKSRRVSNDATA